MSEQQFTPQLNRVAQVKTPNGSKYLQRLCKHFAHRVSADWDENRGNICFAEGTCTLQADALGLQMICSADSEQELVEIVDTIDRHFIRFAKAEAPELIWQ
ncbi:hypothetical protein Rhein_3991 [Rheinheimera sp. A13L]|uniref:DUF2218 domain-containing protein n=1 Tax=Rheinheimera sp. A13L TaxID=506534 RepID=UPI0002125046|nr:DUF2218 domain-containing protein [Rheinheimera sp. A13L]EGM75999.1 hypothetical protein Rhein_3991 [Rheinheimera sp. A13L]